MNKRIRNIILVILIMICADTKAQDILIDSCGIDDSSLLNQYEIQYFQKAFGSYQMENLKSLNSKRVLFLTNNYGARHMSKNEFFNQYCKPWYADNDFPSLESIVLTAEEKLEIDDYDVIIIAWSKVSVTARNRKKFIENGIKYTRKSK